MPSAPLIQCAIIILGALLLICSTFSKRWFYAAWVKTAFWILFVAATLDVSLAVFLARTGFTEATFWRIRTIKSWCVGVGVGMLLLFFLSGEALRGYHRWRDYKRDRNASKSGTSKT